MSDESTPMPPPWMFPWMGGAGNREGQIDNLVPARIREAHQFATFMARRNFPIAAVDNMGNLHTEPAPPLTKPESAAWDAACGLLADYFRGNSDVDVFEGRMLEQIDVETDRRRAGVVGPCPSCAGVGKKKEGKDLRPCNVCRGHGTVLVIPVGQEKPREEK